MISYSWIYPIVRQSRRRFSNFAGGGRQRQRGGMFSAPKTHKSTSLPAPNSDSPDAKVDEKSSSCCFSNVSKQINFTRLYYSCVLLTLYLNVSTKNEH